MGQDVEIRRDWPAWPQGESTAHIEGVGQVFRGIQGDTPFESSGDERLPGLESSGASVNSQAAGHAVTTRPASPVQETQSVEVLLEQERQRRIAAELQMEETQRYAQKTAEELCQTQSMLAEMTRGQGPQVGSLDIDVDILSQNSDRNEDAREELSIAEAVNGEHDSLMAHIAGPNSSIPYRPDTDILDLAAKLLMSVVNPPECSVCHEGIFGDHDPLKMTCHKSGMCRHLNWDVSVLLPDQEYVNGQCPECRRPSRGIMGKKGCEDLHRPLAIYWQGFESTPVTPASPWGTTS